MINEIPLKNNSSDGKLLKDLSTLFTNSPDEAILEAKKYLMKPNFSNYDEFIADVKKTQKSNCCIVSWSKSMLSAHCLDCQKQENSCICIPCYLAGKHDQHHSYLIGDSNSGNCDCGDPNFWKPEGNCPHHPGPDLNPDVTQMTTENRTKFIQIFQIAYHSALTSGSDQILIQIFEWLTSFISIGDGLRRCVAIAVSMTLDDIFLSRLQKLGEKPANKLINLFGKLISDHYFVEKVGSFTLKNYLNLRNIIKSEIIKDDYDKESPPFYPINEYLDFSFHFFNEGALMYLIQNENFDWVEFIINCITFCIETVKAINMDYSKTNDGEIVSQMWYLTKLLGVLIMKDDQHENLQKFIDLYSDLLCNIERLYSFSFPRKYEEESRSPYISLNLSIKLYRINLIFSQITESSSKNKCFSIDVVFSNLLKFLKKENDLKPMSLYGKRSVPISSILPLHHLFYCLLSSYKNSASDVVIENCKKNNVDFQEFCRLTSICPLRILAAFYVYDRFGLLNDASLRQIDYLFDNPELMFNIFFSLLQTMLKIAPNKEEILAMIPETFGVFDDYQVLPNSSEKDKRLLMRLKMNYQNQKEMHQSSIVDASIFIVSLITDFSLSSFDKVLFKRLRAIELLTNKKASAKAIENYIDEKLSNPIFGDDLQTFAERVSTSNGSFFRLKDQHEFTPFFPVITRKNRMKIIMRYNDKLIPIPDYKVQSELDTKMSDCFCSPTFIYAMYRCLISKEMTSKQVGLAMFVLAARNGPKYEIEEQLENPMTIEIDSKDELFQYLEENSKNPNFNPLLLRIILPESLVEMSIIEAVQSMEKLGYEAFEKTDLPSILRPKMADNGDQIKKEKKAKAAFLKQALMKEFQNKQSQFTMGGTTQTHQKDDDDDDDDEEEEETHQSQNGDDKNCSSEIIMCNICQTKLENEVIGFPCLVLPSILPSLIHNKLHNLEENLDELESVFSLSICLHHVHRSCCMSLIKKFKDDKGRLNKEKVYHCMIDRGIRNCFLPLFPDSFNFGSEASEVLRDAVNSFMEMAFKKCSDPTVIIKSYAGAVMILEVRHRSRPECLDNPTVQALLRNFLLSIYTALKGKIPDGFDSSDPLVKLVILLINSDSPTSEHKNFVKQIASSLKDADYIYEFLRRAAIIEDFALKGEIQKRSGNDSKSESKAGLIDWDEVLSFENLIKRYAIEIHTKNIELPLFETIPLADRFVGLYQPPYNMDIFDSSFVKFVDLLTGKIVFFSNTQTEIQGKPDIPHITLYVSQRYHEGLAIFLGLTGPNASDVIISCPAVAKIFNLDGFYIDQFGDIDRGFKRGAILSLSKDRL